jgi:hypothetical protein
VTDTVVFLTPLAASFITGEMLGVSRAWAWRLSSGTG